MGEISASKWPEDGASPDEGIGIATQPTVFKRKPLKNSPNNCSLGKSNLGKLCSPPSVNAVAPYANLSAPLPRFQPRPRKPGYTSAPSPSATPRNHAATRLKLTTKFPRPSICGGCGIGTAHLFVNNLIPELVTSGLTGRTPPTAYSSYSPAAREERVQRRGLDRCAAEYVRSNLAALLEDDDAYVLAGLGLELFEADGGAEAGGKMSTSSSPRGSEAGSCSVHRAVW
ncbi:hypothetical protein B0H13DRAFT_2332705 [Mycena leptocephala]|nr:hypothetical protein B0H13DRAFT_2332705 [Mycena leptocephala]